MSLMKISFYIPTRNSQETIEKCLESVLSQSLKPHEIFIIEGSSKDSTISIIKKIAKKKLSIPINIITQKSIGLANARNLAISNANFEIIASCDSDVVLGKEWLKNIIKPLYDSKIVGVGGHMSEKISSKYDKWRPIHMKQNWGNKKIKNPRFLFGSNTVFKKIVFKKIKYNPNLTSNFEDVDISIKINIGSIVANLPEQHEIIKIKDLTYYYAGGIYYTKFRKACVVVPPPCQRGIRVV